MKTLKCGPVRRDLVRYQDREVEEPRASEIAHHLTECPACRREAESLSVFRSLWADRPEAESTAVARERIRQNAAADRRLVGPVTVRGVPERFRDRLVGRASPLLRTDWVTAGTLAVCAILAVLLISERRKPSYLDRMPRSSPVLTLPELRAQLESRSLEAGASLELNAPR